jgi:hypothetical protein
MNPNTLIPGYLPYVPNEPAISADARGGINAVILATDDTARSHAFQIVVTDIENKPLISDPTGERVFFRAATGEYHFVTNAEVDVLPKGISVLHVMIDGKEEKRFFLNVKSTVFQPASPLSYVPVGCALTGQTRLAEGETLVQVVFAPRFAMTPSIGLGQVVTDTQASPPLVITPTLVDLLDTRMTFALSQAPNSGNYRLGWTAWI